MKIEITPSVSLTVTSKLVKHSIEMNIEIACTVFYRISYVLFLGIFIVWLINAIDNYSAFPTTSKFRLKYGDDGRKNARFPLVSFCRIPTKANHTTMKLWNDAKPCKNMSILSKPYFLSYLETCLENDKDVTVDELMERVTYNVDEVFNTIQTFPSEATPLKDPKAWQDYKKKIITSTFHYDYGNCQTIDISSLSQDEGLFPMEFGSDKLVLFVDFFRVEKDPILQYFFLHNNSNINQFGKDIKRHQFTGGDIRVS